MEVDVQKTDDVVVEANSKDDTNTDPGDKPAQESSSMDVETAASKEIHAVADQREAADNAATFEDANDDDLRHFDVLDDLERHSNQDGSDSEGCSNDSMDSDIPDDEIEAMLEAGLPDEFKGKRPDKRSEMLYEEKEKLVLDEIGHNHFDVLPEGWVQVNIRLSLCNKIYLFLSYTQCNISH